ncbi:hypothetical protein T440DRAFT_179138 [Plenodomus tracheiphilus IPT5]|uniref:Uncharacterized protein n=1 Tax=Plenodomus tracheiphilus IPT5 TaxID=1408161 RepID=A0A6A7AY02_9PLEO|nr:hypothetical protein T440DRAFT_179138 [Plenodomus tracheiphilus IPT5]
MFSLRSIVLLVVSYVVIPRLTFLPQNVHSLLIVFGPFLIPRALDWVNVSRTTNSSVPVRPVPPRVKHALNLLFLSACVFFVLSFARFAPENIFIQTRSHIRTETSVIFARLRHLRPLTAGDEALRVKFNYTRNKLLYLAYGPDTLLNCNWCADANGDDQMYYFLYSLPGILAPHILQLGALGVATSSFVGAEASRVRTHATIAGVVMLAGECWYMFSYNLEHNKRAFTIQQLDSAFWRVRFIRYITFAVVDLALALVLWATSTNRWLSKPLSIAERLETATKQSEDTLNKLRALGLLTNSVNRDAALRGVREEYWRTEGQIMAEMVQDEAVTEQINRVINKMDFSALQGRVGEVADGILKGIDGLRASQIVVESDMSD